MRIIRRSTLTGLACAFGLLALSATPALAAAPEEPVEVTVQEPVHATEATFHGFLNPATPEPVKPGTYEFLYKKSATECKGGSKAPVSPAISLGGPHEEVSETVTGLEAGTTYTMCLLARSGTEINPADEIVSAPVTFTTETPAEAPETTSPPKTITAGTATFEGVLNPLVEAETGWYFAYSTGAKCTSGGTGGGETPHEAPAKVKALPVTPTEVGGLEPHQKYKVCLVATDPAGDPTAGNEVSFETLPLPPSLLSESTSEVQNTGAKLDAQINTNNQKAKYTFEYSTEASGEPLVLKGTIVPVNGASELKAEDVEQTASVSTGVLLPGTTYYYRVVATNATAEKNEGPVQSFTTVPTPSTDAITALTATTVTFNGHLTPLNKAVATQDHFVYKLGKECAGESETPSVEAGKGEGTEAKATANVTGLQPNHEYTVCFVTSNESGSQDGSEVHFTTPPVPAKVLSEAVSGVSASEATLEAQVNPNNQKIECHFRYWLDEGEDPENAALTVPCEQATLEGFGEQRANVLVAGLQVGKTYSYRIVLTDTAISEVIDGQIQSFTPQGEPLVITGEAQAVTRTSAALFGSVNPAGLETHYYFAYIEQAAYDKAVAEGAEDPYEHAFRTPEASIPAGFTAQAVGPVTAGVSPGKTYDYALIATPTPTEANPSPTATVGANKTFTTSPVAPPILSGVSVQGVTSSSATITATLNPQNLTTRYELQVGATPSALQPVASGNTSSATELSLPVSALASATTYYYRLTASGPDGTVTPEGSFTTAPAPAGTAAGSLPATIPYQSIAELNAKEAKEDKKLPNPTTPLTNAQKLKKALKSCKKDKSKSKRHKCEATAHKKFGSKKKK